ncbi:hypothetical protein HCB44_02365 [Listeria sp. FSL L7-0229]|uniref:NACHT domain-containing protein n=1 Tax=Listeria cossartiae TaxID=2838249 RepID=UPI00162A7398|nr:hypothetical protein [Listeria cossartiae]MBC2191125.1 hypothetical protein [Listeria cossartiae subsp. cossartiae]
MFIINDLLDFGFGEALKVLKDKKRANKILDELKWNIRSFNESFNNTEIDTNTFDKYMTESPLVSSYFTKLFLSGQRQDNTIQEKIINDLIDMINSKRVSQGISPFTDKALVEDYFNQLSEHLKMERKRILGLENQLLIAEIKDTILPVLKNLLDEQLCRPTNRNFKFTSQLLYNKCQDSIISLGERYSPEINIVTNGSKPFEALFRTDKFQQIFKNLYNNLLDKYLEFKNKCDFSELFEEFSLIDIDSPFDKYQIEQNIDRIASICNSIRKKTIEMSDFERHSYYNTLQALAEFEDFVAETKVKLYENPFLIVTGDAAIGKSHLLADNVERMQQLGHPIIFSIGQQFLSSKNPLQQIVEHFGYSISVEEFLYQFDKFSEEKGKIGCLVIDALNETDSNRFWKTQLQGLTSTISKYKNIGIVLSIRSTYISSVLPENYIEKNGFQVYNHSGITAAEDDEIEKIEQYYGLSRGELLKIYPEFSNPLFLKVAAISAPDTAKFQKKMTWENLICQYVKGIEKEISSENRLNYNGFYLSSVIQIISTMMFESHSNFLNYKEIKKKIAEELEYDMDSNRRYLDELIRENLFSKFTMFNGEEKIHFTYEKIRDFFIASNIVREFVKDGMNLEKVVQDSLLPNDEYGVIEILFFMLPNIVDSEITDFIPVKEDIYRLEKAFIGSIPWRRAPLKTESIKNILKNVLSNANLASDFYANQFLLSTDSESPFNAEWLTKFLFPLNNDLRDYVWTTNISIRYNSFPEQMVKRIKRNYTCLSDIQLKLALEQLTWTLSSVNGSLRDKATKIISLILIKKPLLIKELIGTFKNITDLYIYERLYAAVFGAIVKLNDTKIIEETALSVYECIFNQNEVIPHVLLRDYARQIVEYAVSKGLCNYINQEKITPPYNSPWYEFEASNDDVDAYETKYRNISKDEGHSVYRVLNSMTTEYGRGICAYGDFGRYIFGSRLSSWSNQFDDQYLSNIAFIRVFELGFNPEIHAYFDCYMTSNYDRHNNRIERIGKKYQWIAFYEMVAKLADNFQIYEEVIVYDKEYEENYFNHLLNSFDEINNKEDNILNDKMNREDHIMTIRKENVHYFQGPFEYYMKTIDPTYHTELPKPTKKLISYSQQPSLTEPNVFNHEKEFIECQYNNKKYLSLYFRYEHKSLEKKQSSDLVGVAFFSPIESRDKVIEYNMKNYGNGVSAPSSTDVFLHELYWSSAYEHFESLYYEEQGRTKIGDYAVYEYLWEPNDDFSIEDSVSMYIPSKTLVDYYSLQSLNDGVWKNDSNEIVAFDGSVFGYEHCLWFEKEKIIQYMNETNQTIFWRSWGEETIGSDFVEKWFLIENDGEKYKNHLSQTEKGNWKRHI